jgi:hypothetical protein
VQCLNCILCGRQCRQIWPNSLVQRLDRQIIVVQGMVREAGLAWTTAR